MLLLFHAISFHAIDSYADYYASRRFIYLTPRHAATLIRRCFAPRYCR